MKPGRTGEGLIHSEMNSLICPETNGLIHPETDGLIHPETDGLIRPETADKLLKQCYNRKKYVRFPSRRLPADKADILTKGGCFMKDFLVLETLF